MMSLALVAGAAYFLFRNRRPHQRSRVHLRKLRAKLRAQCRRKLRSPKFRGAKHRKFRQMTRKIMRSYHQ